MNGIETLHDQNISRPVLVISIPAGEVDELRRYRDYVAESLAAGLLVLSKQATYAVESFPTMTPVVLAADVPDLEAPIMFPDPAPPAQAALSSEMEPPIYVGRSGEEKRGIFARLQAYRAKHKLGCLRHVADQCKFGITEALLRDILTGAASVSIAEWRDIDRVLTTLEAEADGQTT